MASLDYKTLFESVPCAYLVLAPDFVIVAVSDAYLRAAMMKREDILGRGLFDVFTDDLYGTQTMATRNMRDSLDRVLQTGAADTIADQKYDIRRPQSEGGPFVERHWSLVNVPVFGPDKKIAYIIQRVEDVTEKVSSDKLFHQIVESSPTANIVVDQAGKIALVNVAAEKLFLYARQELIGQSIEMLMPTRFRKHHPDQVAGFVARPQTRAMGVGRDLFGLRKDGAEMPIEIGLNPIETSTGRLILVAIIDLTDRKALERNLEEQVKERTAQLAKANSELRCEMQEKMQLQSELAQSQKMESVGRLAGGVAHDFNNLLTAIKGYGEFVRDALTSEDTRRADVVEILSAADRAASLTRQLLAFSRRQVLAPQTVDINRTVGDMTNMLRRLIGEDVKLAVQTPSEPCLVKVDPGQAEQIIMNLTINARDAMPKGGTITLKTATVNMDDDFFTAHPDLCRGPLVCLRVSDTGCGMTEDVKNRIFEPFFTTKARGEGTGLGLSTVFGIVKQSGAEIEVESALNRGTTFRIYFPKMETATKDKDQDQDKGKDTRARGQETVLLVEDEGTIRRLAERSLIANGYAVLTAADGREALKVLEQYAKPVDLLVTDVVMPGMSGRELAQEIARRNMARRTLFVSGYTDDAIARHGILEPGLAFLYKPFSPNVLLLKLREVLDGPADQAKA